MSVPCDCTNCGGSDPFAMCDNAIMEAQIKAIVAEQRTFSLKTGLIALTPIALAVMFAVAAKG